MKLGWVIIGEVCLGKHHATKNVNVRKIYVNPDGRPSVLKPCPSCICVQEDTGYHSGFTPWKENDIGSTVFHRTKNDDEPGKSTEDKMFLKLMEKEFVKEPAGNWSAPLPFKPLKKRLPNNKSMAVRRANSLAKSLQFNSVKREHFLDFMKKLLERGHAEIAPPLKENEECWYLPVFGVYHPKKPSRIRCVFDSAAKFRGTSLNDVLMTGPDLNNSLLGVLLRVQKNRVNRIHRSTKPEQWNYVPTSVNPADRATRSMVNDFSRHDLAQETPQLVQPEDDKEVRPDALRCACAKSFKGRADRSVESFRKAEIFVIKAVQKETYKEEIRLLEAKMHLPKSSSIMALNPYLDEDVRHYHQSVRHQGRHLTEGAVRSGGYWITGVKRLISSILHSCVQCRKLRGKEEVQLMSDLPADRLEHTPPFTNVGVDAFGPWTITTRRTRGGSANSKRWAILFTCLTTRAIHIELVEEMSSSAFINALKRFEAFRGKVKLFRSDRGTNFVGATDSLKIDAVNVEEKKIVDHLYQTGTKWIFNAPHSSHMGGVWERLIRICRKILESMLAETPYKTLTHEVLSTFMAEVCAIVNNRPIVNVSTDPENPFILSPATILTQKVGIDHVEDSVGEIDTKDLLKTEWKRVSALSEIFWNRWKKNICTHSKNVENGVVQNLVSLKVMLCY
nr:uncharacterized protein LOC113821724 [Penaeus vannamei]